MASLRIVAIVCATVLAFVQPGQAQAPVPASVQAALIKWAAQAPATAPVPAPVPAPAPVPVPVPVPLPAVAAPPPGVVSGVKLPESLTNLDNKAIDEYNQVAGRVRGEAEKLKGEGEQVYHQVEGAAKQDLQKFNNLPQGQKVGIEVGSAVGVAALAGSIGGIAAAAHQADVKRAKKEKKEIKEKLLAKMKLNTTPKPTVVTVPVVVRVPVTPAPKSIFAWPRLFEKDDGKQSGITMAQGTLMGAAALVFLACALLGVSFVMYLKNRSEEGHRSLSLECSEEGRSLSRVSVEDEDDGNPLLA